MAFSNSSYFAGVGTVFAAVTLGFAVGAMITSGGVQPPNRLERVASSAALPASNVHPADAARAAPGEPAAAVPTAAVDGPRPVVQQPPPAPPVMARSEDAANANVQQAQPAPPVVARSEDAATARNERASLRAADLKRESYRKKEEERRFAERKKRQDIEDAANAVRQMRRDGVIDQVVERDRTPRFGLFGGND
jgi:hypothetical protein